MKIVCPGCGLTASLEAWFNDKECRQLLMSIVSFPSSIAPVTPGYLSLFRPETRALAWKKATRLTKELLALVSTGHVQITGKVSRPCPPTVWALAIEDMVSRRDRLTRPLKNHNYLRQVAYDLADAADRQREASVRSREISGGGMVAPKVTIKRSAVDILVHGDDN